MGNIKGFQAGRAWELLRKQLCCSAASTRKQEAGAGPKKMAEVEVYLHIVPYNNKSSPLDAKVRPNNPLLPSRDLPPFVLPKGEETAHVSRGNWHSSRNS